MSYRNTLISFAAAVIETAREIKQPIPTNMLYLAAQQKGIGYEDFNNVLEILIKNGKIKRADMPHHVEAI